MEKELIDWALKFSTTLEDETPAPCNPLAQFIPYVSNKEIVHSQILADLLSPSGSHGQKDTFLREFISRLGLNFNDYTNFSVIRERKVSRILTSGSPRSIDILLTYKDAQNKLHSIIIENKLNHAPYQDLQLEDYTKGIQKEQINVDKIVLFHDKIQSMVGNYYREENIIYWYPEDIAKWLISSSSNANILSYANYLKSINATNIPFKNAIKMKGLSLNELKQLKKVVDAYNNLAAILRDEIVEATQAALPEFSIQSKYRKQDGLQIWNQEDYKRNDVWIALFSPDSPVNDEAGNDLYLYTHMNNLDPATQIAEKCGFKFYGQQEDYAYFRAPNNFRYYMFDQSNRQTLKTEITRLLKILHES